MVVYWLLLLYFPAITYGKITVPTDDIKLKLLSCVQNVVLKYYPQKCNIAMIDMYSDDNEIAKTLNVLSVVTIVSRKSIKDLNIHHSGYLVIAGSVRDLIMEFHNVIIDSAWNPYANFTIIVMKMELQRIREIFDILLKYHVINAVVIDGQNDNHMYTYNPYENFRCGKSYDKVIEFGTCENANNINIFPYKLATRLQNCTLIVTLPHWPPYTINPPTSKGKLHGTDQFAIEMLSEVEKFKIKYKHTLDGNDFIVIDSNFTASGSLGMLQNNLVDIVIGGNLLISSRAKVFNYLYSHLAYTDEIITIVRKSGPISDWRNIYIEFSGTIWLLLITVFFVYSGLLMILLKAKDKASVLLQILNNLLQHDFNVKNLKFRIKCIIIFWIWFTYLINSIYQSTLFSLVTNPSKEYQIAITEDLTKYSVEPCLSQDIINLLHATYGDNIIYSNRSGCNGWMENIKTVGNSKQKLYTYSVKSIYDYEEFQFLDEWGESTVYIFKKPMMKIIYAIYLYKGFPLTNVLDVHMLRICESGLFQKRMVDLYQQQRLKLMTIKNKELKGLHILPWWLFGLMITASVLTFILELLQKRG